MGKYGQSGRHEQPANGMGSAPKDHVVRKWDRRNIQNCYSREGREAKMRADALSRVSTRNSSLWSAGSLRSREELLGRGGQMSKMDANW